MSSLRVCYYGAYDLTEPHNTTFLAGLRKAGVEVVECNLPQKGKRDEAANYKGAGKMLAVAWGFLKNGFSLFFRLLHLKNLDAIVVGYPGYFDVPFARVAGLVKRIPVLFNVHISLYETIVVDRKFVAEKSVLARALKFYDRLLFKLSNAVIVDTNAHCEYFSELYNIPREKFQRVFVGADAIFQPRPASRNEKIKVLFYGSFVPLQGIEHIIHAAHLLKDEPDILFEIIGRGQTRDEMLALAQSLSLKNINFIEWVSLNELVDHIAAADICLGGQFGEGTKANLVIGYKCFQMLACGRPVIVSNSAGNRELLTHGEDSFMCNAADPEDLSRAILTLSQDADFRKKIAAGALQTYQSRCSAEHIGAELQRIIENEINPRSASAQEILLHTHEPQ